MSQITHFVQSSLKKNDDFFKTTIIKRYRAGTKINGVFLLLFLKLNINVNNRVIYSSIQSLSQSTIQSVVNAFIR